MQRFTAIEYLMIDIANSFGLEKAKWSERIKWFNRHKNNLEEMVSLAESPAMFFAGVEAWKNVNNGLPSGYPISLDATSSGLQLLAILTGDREAAKLCNVVNTGNREDAYTIIYDALCAELSLLGSFNARIKPDDVKRAILTSLYGSQAIPKEVFGEGTQLRTFYNIMNEMTPAVWELNQAFLDIWDPTATKYSWILPDNFHVHIKVMAPVKEIVHFFNEPYEVVHMENIATEQGRSLGANCIHSIDGMIVREMIRRCSYNPDTLLKVTEALLSEKQGANTTSKDDQMVVTLWDNYQKSGYLSARILDHLNMGNIGLVDQKIIWELINSLPEKPFNIMPIHDCFRVLPQYGNDLRYQYNLQLMLIAKSNLLEDLLSQIIGRKVSIGKLDPTLWKDILDADYALS